jgi:cardiolipin synthase
MVQAVMVWNWIMEDLLYVNLFLSVMIVFFQRRDPKAVWTWLLILYFVPVLGFFFYLIFAQDYHRSKMFRIKEVEDRLCVSDRRQEYFLKNNIRQLDKGMKEDYGDLVHYNLEQSGSVLTLDNQVDIFTDGQEKFEDLCRELRQARYFIHIQYYIIKNDELFGEIAPVLEERAQAGVQVRVLYDGMGSRLMPEWQWKELRQAGIKTACFFPPFWGRLNLRVNYRNHRKIVVIDGRTGYVGGFNIGREYLGRSARFGYWRDTHLKIQGDAVISLQIRFALDWNYAGKENLFLDSRYFQNCRKGEGNVISGKMPGQVGIQIIASGPDSKWRQVRDNYLRLIHKARHHIYIQTPYFIPDEAVLSALRVAAGSGMDVRLMIPCKPDHLFVYWATYSYMGELVKANARCYVYENGFLHAKGVMVDGRVSCCGTANLDIRSFELNFEVNATIYDQETTRRLEAAFLKDLEFCREVTREAYDQRGLWVRLKEQGSRLMSPLL